MSSEIKYQFFTKGFDPKTDKFSLLVEDSDYLTNESVLNGLIGNLMKFGPNGRIEPYLARSFTVSSNGKVWTYFLRDNLTCSDGTPITARSFVSVLTRNLRKYSRSSGTMDFELLEGWTEFKFHQVDTISGLTAENNNVVFQFTKRPEDLNEFLRMPYFGFWCHDDERKDWKSNFVSSGPFTLNPKSTEHEIILDKRKNWFSIPQENEKPSSFKFSFVGENDVLKSTERTIIEVFTANKIETPSGYTEIYSPPIALLAMVLSPYKEGPFKHPQNRRAFLERLEKAKENSHFNAKFFYSSCKSEVSRTFSTSFTPDMVGYELNVAFQNRGYAREDEQEVKRLVIAALEGSGAKVQFHAKNPFEDNWRKRLLSNTEFDIRMNAVDIGGNIRNLVIKMMFCSNLGVSYPDPSGKICKLTKEVDNNDGPYTPEQIAKFNQILYEDASVIPLAHYGTKWILTPDIDPKSFASTVISPLYETIKLK